MRATSLRTFLITSLTPWLSEGKSEEPVKVTISLLCRKTSILSCLIKRKIYIYLNKAEG